jgi:hypothetical protein
MAMANDMVRCTRVIRWWHAYVVFVLFCLIGSFDILHGQTSAMQDRIPIQRATTATTPQFKTLDDVAVQAINGTKDFSSTGGSYSITKSPMGAVWRSLILPGWGQVYNEAYWKAPLALGGAVAILYQVLNAESLRSNRNTTLNIALDSNSVYTRQQIDRLKLEVEFYRDLRDRYAVYLLGVYLVTAMDAYVGSHLFDFDVSDNVKANLSFSPVGRVHFTLRW